MNKHEGPGRPVGDLFVGAFVSTFVSARVNPNMAQVTDVDPKEVASQLPQLCVVDVRRPEEYTGELGHIAESMLVTLDTLPARLSEIPTGRPIVFVCRSGGRSAQAAAFALSQGRQAVYNLSGGMLAWNELGLAVVGS